MFSVGQKLSHWLTLADFHCRIKSKKSLFIIKGTTYLSFLLFSHWTASVWQSTFSKHDYYYNVVQYRIVITTALNHNCSALPFAVQCTGALKLILLRRPTGRIPWISDDRERDKKTHTLEFSRSKINYWTKWCQTKSSITWALVCAWLLSVPEIVADWHRK